MKNIIWILIMVMSLALAACGQASAPTPIPTLELNAGSSGSQTDAPASQGGVVASAEVRPKESVELSFPLLGAIKTVDVKVGDTVNAGQALAALDTVVQEARVAELEANITAAEAQLAYLIRSGAKQDQLDVANADIDRAKALADQARATLAQAVLYTPNSGTIISVDIAPGETANPGQVVIVVADLSYLQIETTDLSERDIPAVQVGQVAKVFIEALDESFEGRVVDIARQSETIGGDVTYEVTIELGEQPDGLRWGMSAEVEIVTEQ